MILAKVYDKGEYSNQHANPTVFVFMISATISLAGRMSSMLLGAQYDNPPVETQNFSKNENEDHGDENFRLIHQSANALRK